MRTLFAPIYYATRALLREPAFAILVILVLALGIAANTTIYTVIESMSSLPYSNPGRLVMLWESNLSQPEPAGSHMPAARNNFDAWRKDTRSFETLEAYRQVSFNLTGLQIPEHLDAARATAGFFRAFGVEPIIGRTFLPEDEVPGHDHVVVITQSFATTHFPDSTPLGQVLHLDDVAYSIIGVLPREFHLPNYMRGLVEYRPVIWAPLLPITTSDPPIAAKRRNLLVYARLRRETSFSEAGAEMRTEAARLARENPALNTGYGAKVYSLDLENTDPNLKRAMHLLWAAVAVVLLLSCANLGNMMLLRTLKRKKEIAIMIALGAKRSDLIRTTTAEALVLSVLGAILGMAAAFAGVRLIVALKPGDIKGIERVVVNGHSLLFTAVLLIGVVTLVALIPAWLASRGDLTSALKQGAGVAVMAKPRSFSRTMLAGAEIAIALVLAIASTLLVRSFTRLLLVNTGFGTKQILTAHLSLPQRRYSKVQDRTSFCDRLIEALRSLPQVESASLIDHLPLYEIRYAPFEIEGQPHARLGDAPISDYANVRPDFFSTMRIAMLSGRSFTDDDTKESADKVVIINETMARKFWPNRNPVGTRLRSLDGFVGDWATIVGVVADVIQFTVQSPARPELFWPASHMTSMSIVVRTRTDPLSAGPALQKTVWEVDKDQPISDVQTLTQILDENSISQARFNMGALGLFAVIGILLAIVGVHGLISYVVSSRTKEIGIRLALGAQKKDVFSSLLRQTLPFALLGVLLGVALSLVGNKLINNLLFGITALDPLTYVLSPLAFLVVILLTLILPAWRATRVQPATVLRQE